MSKKTRTKWTEGLVVKTFGLTKLTATTFPLLEEWLTIGKASLPTKDIDFLKELHEELVPNINYWKEETIKMKFQICFSL